MVNVAINGLGRVGRAFLRFSLETEDFDVVAVNDLGDIENIAYLLEHDSVYGRSHFTVTVEEKKLIIGDREIKFLQEKDPADLPWSAMDVDIVLESTGVFTDYADAKKHIEAGAKRVVLSAPGKGSPEEAEVKGGTVLMGMNKADLAECQISSNASCTTNATSPIIGILHEAIGIEKAILNTIHAYTASQSLVDSVNKKDMRIGRAAAYNIIPSTTGAAKATTEVHKELDGKFDGLSLRVPVPVGSVVDITFIASKDTTVDEVNTALTNAMEDERWEGIFTATDQSIVSTDVIGARYATIADLNFTKVVDGNLVKIIAWYDNESSYAHTLIKHVEEVARILDNS